jgi:hypothetical protein
MAAADDACCYEEEEAQVEGFVVDFIDHILNKCVSIWLGIDMNPLSPAEQCAQIRSPLELVKAAEWFFAQKSPFGVYKRHRQEMLPPLGFISAEYSPLVPVRLMFGCVATACQRLATAPAKMRVTYRTAWRLAKHAMDRVTQGRVSKVQVRCHW